MPGSDRGEKGKKLYVEQGYFMPFWERVHQCRVPRNVRVFPDECLHSQIVLNAGGAECWRFTHSAHVPILIIVTWHESVSRFLRQVKKRLSGDPLLSESIFGLMWTQMVISFPSTTISSGWDCVRVSTGIVSNIAHTALHCTDGHSDKKRPLRASQCALFGKIFKTWRQVRRIRRQTSVYLLAYFFWFMFLQFESH